jgi:hydroxymethylbilane synthase
LSNITVGTRGSLLALTQTGIVVEALKKSHTHLKIDLKKITTTGDKILDKELNTIGGKGLFIKEIEEALHSGEIDFAVHSLKDVPHTLPDEFKIGAVLKREDPRDVIIFKKGVDLNSISQGAIIGTGSLRRILQLNQIKSGIEYKPIRGNVDTRLRKLANNEFDGIILAAAGLKRLGWIDENNNLSMKDQPDSFNIEFMDTEAFIPSVGQGALALEIRKYDNKTFELLQVLNFDRDLKCVGAERAFLKEVDGGCEIPIGAYCKSYDDNIRIIGFVGNKYTQKLYRSEVTGDVNDFENIGIKLAKNILELQNQDKYM